MAYRAGSAFVSVSPSFRGWQTKVSAWTKSNLKPVKIPTELDLDSRSMARVQKRIDAAARDRKATVHVDADVDQAMRGISRVEQRARQSRPLIHLGLALAPAAIAAAGAGAGGFLGLGALGVGLGAGVGGFAALATAEVGKLNKQLEELKKATKEVTTARAALAEQVSQEPSASNRRDIAQAEEELNTALRSRKAIMDSFTPAQRRAADAIENFKNEWDGFLQTIERPIFGALIAGMGALEKSFPAIARFIRPVADGFRDIFRAVGDEVGSKGFRDFADTVGRFSRGVLADAARGTMNLAQAFGNLLLAFMPLGSDMSDGLVDLTKRFRNWSETVGGSSGFREFTRWVRDIGPEVLETLGTVGTALFDIAKAAAPVGEASLPIIRGLARLLSGIAESPAGPQLIAAAAGLAAVNLAFQGMNAIRFSALATGIGDVGRKMRTTAGRATLLRDGVRGLAGPVGLGLLIQSTREANGGLGVLEGVAGGAALGFAVGGPWGAAIGAGVMSLKDLVFSFRSVEDQVPVTRDTVASYIDTLNRLTGANTRATRAEIARRLEEEGVLEMARRLGVNTDDLVSAILGRKKAEDRVNQSLDEAYKRNGNLADVISKVSGRLFTHKKQVRDDAAALRRQAEATTGLSADLLKLGDRLGLGENQTRKLSKAIQAQEKATYRANGATKLSDQQLERLGKQMGLNREQTQRLIDKYRDIPTTVETKANFVDRQARKAMKAFRDHVSGSFKKLSDDEYLFNFRGDVRKFYAGMATGGYVSGPGTGTSDSIPARLSNGEFVQRAAAVKREGVGAMEALNQGKATVVPRFAEGGSVNMKARMDFSEVKKWLSNAVRLAASLGGGAQWKAGDGRRVGYSGVTLDRYTFRLLRVAERLLGQRFNLSQGSFSTSVAASGGTHAGGGAFDASSPFSRAAIVALRRVGFAAWRRYPSQGPWGTHIHSIAAGDRLLSPAARSQVAAYRSGGDGLGGRDYEPRVKVISFGRGGGGNLSRFERLIIGRESSGSVFADNPTSSAFGLGQLILANRQRYASRLGVAPGTTSRDAQIAMMRMYIRERYGNARNAWSFHRRHGYYDRGAWDVPHTMPATVHKGEMVLTEPIASSVRKAVGNTDSSSGRRMQGIRITNWKTGEGYMYDIAESAIAGDHAFAGATDRMHR